MASEHQMANPVVTLNTATPLVLHASLPIKLGNFINCRAREGLFAFYLAIGFPPGKRISAKMKGFSIPSS
jgi:hypothetical protein